MQYFMQFNEQTRCVSCTIIVATTEKLNTYNINRKFLFHEGLALQTSEIAKNSIMAVHSKPDKQHTDKGRFTGHL